MSDQHVQSNVQQHARSNGTASASSEVKTGVQDQQGKSVSMLEQLPPELAHITANFQPLSRLLERSAQECYNNLDETITALSNIPSHIDEKVLAHPENFKNIVVGNNDVQKRMSWLEFGKAQRERFVKLLVLTRWSRQVEDVGKVIDLFNWMNTQSTLFGEVDESMAQLRRWLDGEKIPAPDLETALEILATGTSTKMPDLGFVKPEPLTATEILDTFRNINTMLHLRLNTVEELPDHLRNFKIASGRVTFTIPNEFELDLSIADEDPASQFYFIDFRFLFSPSSEIPAGSVHDFEARANNALASEGLSGCYNLFHDFVLTHKINILRRQAINLNRTSWAGSLVIEQVHRSLIIQYWTGKPGPKSWIEVGIASNKSNKPPSPYIPQPQSGLNVKWIRSGEEVKDYSLNLDDAELDSAWILENVLAEHSEYILSSISDAYPETSLFYDSVVENSSLVSLSDTAQPIIAFPLFGGHIGTLAIEPMAGNFYISPITREALHCQDQLNTLANPSKDGSNVLRSQHPLMLLTLMAQSASASGWDLIIRPKNVYYPRSSTSWLKDVQSCAFRPQVWHKCSWVIGVTVDSTGEIEWSVFEEPTGQPFTSISPLSNWFELVIPKGTPSNWLALGQSAWCLIYLEAVHAYLQRNDVKYRTVASHSPERMNEIGMAQELPVLSAGGTSSSAHHKVISVVTNPTTITSVGEEDDRILEEPVPATRRSISGGARHTADLKSMSSFSGIVVETSTFLKDSSAAQCLVGGSLTLFLMWNSYTSPLALKGVLRHAPEYAQEFSMMAATPNMEWTQSGAFALRASQSGNQVGPDYPMALDVLIGDVLWLCRVPSYLSISKRRGFRCTKLSMHSMAFKYRYKSADEYLTATCTIHNQTVMDRLSGQPNPPIELSCQAHRMLLQPFKNMLNQSTCGRSSLQEGHAIQVLAFEEITKALIYAIPLASALNKLAAKTSMEDVSLHISPHAWNNILLHYQGKNDRHCILRVCLRQDYRSPAMNSQPDRPITCTIEHVDLAGEPGGSMMEPGLRDDLAQYFASVVDQATPEAQRLRHGILFSLEDTEVILDNLDEAVRAAVRKEPRMNEQKKEPSDTVMSDIQPTSNQLALPQSAQMSVQEPSLKRQRAEASTLQPQAQPMARDPSNQNQNQSQHQSQNQALAHAQLMAHATSNQGRPPPLIRRPSNQAQAHAQAQAQAQMQAQVHAQQARAQAQMLAHAQLQAQIHAQQAQWRPQKQPQARPSGPAQQAAQAQQAAWQNMQGANGAHNNNNMTNGTGPGNLGQRSNGGAVEVVEID